MIGIRTITAITLSLLFVVCAPLHALPFHHHESHHASQTSPTQAMAAIAHFEDMTSTPWVAFLILIFGAAVVLSAFFQIIRNISQRTYEKPTLIYHPPTVGVRKWLRLHRTSPPRIA